MIGAYIRVSSASQTTEAQRAEVERWLQAHGMTAVQWFEDVESGAKAKRPGLDALQAEIFNGTVKTVVVWRLDRLARSQRDGLNLLADWCERGVRVVSVSQQIDLSGKVGQLIAGVLFAVADMELEAIRERQAVGIAKAKAKGAYKGRKRGTVKFDPAEVRRLHAAGWQPGQIMKALGIKSHATVKRYLAADCQRRLKNDPPQRLKTDPSAASRVIGLRAA
ncbi:MAG: recombinase family protein [Pseudomonadota bacterium]